MDMSSNISLSRLLRDSKSSLEKVLCSISGSDEIQGETWKTGGYRHSGYGGDESGLGWIYSQTSYRNHTRTHVYGFSYRHVDISIKTHTSRTASRGRLVSKTKTGFHTPRQIRMCDPTPTNILMSRKHPHHRRRRLQRRGGDIYCSKHGFDGIFGGEEMVPDEVWDAFAT